jgi:hypothetical protein
LTARTCLPTEEDATALRFGSSETDAGAPAIARSPHLARVKHLELSRNRISAEAEAELRARFGDVKRSGTRGPRPWPARRTSPA